MLIKLHCRLVDTSLVNAVTDKLTSRTTTYQHDQMDRLIVADTSNGGPYESFDYDKVGNRTVYYIGSGAPAARRSRTTAPTS